MPPGRPSGPAVTLPYPVMLNIGPSGSVHTREGVYRSEFTEPAVPTLCSLSLRIAGTPQAQNADGDDAKLAVMVNVCSDCLPVNTPDFAMNSTASW